jgi:molecular chaperone GrpE (heat shock protein)
VPATVSTTSTSQEQKKKDADARWILETELKKLEARQTDLKTEYNQGAPEKQGAESRNHQKYLDRIAQLKDSLSRNAEDIAGLRRELERLSVNR